MALYSIRSERALCETLNYHLLSRWFLDMDLMEAAFDPTSFPKNRERLLEHDVARTFFDAVVRLADDEKLLSREHVTVDGTLIEAAASIKSFRPNEPVEPAPPVDDPGNPTVNFRGERRTNKTHTSTTDPESRLAKKRAGKEAKLSYAAHTLMENRNGMVVDLQVTLATGTAERDAAPVLLDRAKARGFRPKTLGADKGYDPKDCVQDMRKRGVTPHVSRNIHKTHRSAIDGRTTRHAGYAIRQRLRKQGDETFGWGKTIGGLRRTRSIGLAKTQLAAYLIGTADNLVRLSKLAA